jgi:hypothetical protein
MKERKLSWHPCIPGDPSIRVRQSANPQATIAALEDVLSRTTDERLRKIWQKQLKELKDESK